VIFEAELRRLGEVIVCTDDGSYGRKGFVTDAAKDALASGGIGRRLHRRRLDPGGTRRRRRRRCHRLRAVARLRRVGQLGRARGILAHHIPEGKKHREQQNHYKQAAQKLPVAQHQLELARLASFTPHLFCRVRI